MAQEDTMQFSAGPFGNTAKPRSARPDLIPKLSTLPKPSSV